MEQVVRNMPTAAVEELLRQAAKRLAEEGAKP
jgi:hypothetical protein